MILLPFYWTICILFFTFITKIKVLIGWLGFPFFNLPTRGWWLQVMVWMCFPPVLYITLSRWSNPPSLHTNLNVQLLERHLRLTVCAWYTQCMIHSQDNTALGAACPTFLFLFPSQHHSSREREHWRVQSSLWWPSLPTIIPFKFPAVMYLFCTCACIQLVINDYVIMNLCTCQQMATHTEQGCPAVIIMIKL